MPWEVRSIAFVRAACPAQTWRWTGTGPRRRWPTGPSAEGIVGMAYEFEALELVLRDGLIQQERR